MKSNEKKTRIQEKKDKRGITARGPFAILHHLTHTSIPHPLRGENHGKEAGITRKSTGRGERRALKINRERCVNLAGRGCVSIQNGDSERGIYLVRVRVGNRRCVCVVYRE